VIWPLNPSAHRILHPPVKHWESHSASKQHRQALTRFKKIEDTVARKGAADVDDRGGKRRRLDDVASVDVGPSVEMTTTADDENIDEPPASAPSAPAPAIDAELDSFLSSIAADITAPNTTEEKTASAAPPRQKMYKPSQPETQVSYEAAPMRNLPANSQTTGGDDGKEEEEETEGDRRRREEREEKEEIMDRLMDEQRAQ
jgi:zinc finger protein 830